MTWDELRLIHPWLPETSEGWHQHPNGKGWVQDTARVADSAQVSGNAQVYGNAQVCDRAQVYDRARVSGNARVCDRAQVCGNVQVYGIHNISPIYIQGSRYWIGYSGCGDVSSGCITKPLSWWLENVERCAEEHGYTPEEQVEYRSHVEHIATWMELHVS